MKLRCGLQISVYRVFFLFRRLASQCVKAKIISKTKRGIPVYRWTLRQPISARLWLELCDSIGKSIFGRGNSTLNSTRKNNIARIVKRCELNNNKMVAPNRLLRILQSNALHSLLDAMRRILGRRPCKGLFTWRKVVPTTSNTLPPEATFPCVYIEDSLLIKS
jgi:hypothetical protein